MKKRRRVINLLNLVMDSGIRPLTSFPRYDRKVNSLNLLMESGILTVEPFENNEKRSENVRELKLPIASGQFLVKRFPLRSM